MSGQFFIKQNDTGPSLLFNLDPTTVVLTGASVAFNMRAAGGALKIDRAPAVVTIDQDTPQVRYDWQAGDTDTPGVYEAEFEVTFSSGEVQTFPNFTSITVLISEDIG